MGSGAELKYRVPKWATKMLVEFVNAKDFSYFRKRWQWHLLMNWLGGEKEFNRTQALIRGVWRGERDGATEVALRLGLGLPIGRKIQTYKRPEIYADWKMGTLRLRVLDLNELVWLTLLHESRHLAICENSTEKDPRAKCPTPYFLKYRPQSRFCSDGCAKPSQRAAKRKWWRKKTATEERQRI